MTPIKNYLIILLAVFSSCRHNNDNTTQNAIIENADTTSATLDSLCYLFHFNNDTQAVKMIIDGNNVKGKMMYIPAGKDRRFGNIRGEKNGAILDLQWTFIQEGIKDSTRVIFKMEANQLLQKPASYHSETGKEFVADTAQFRISYERIDCKNFPKHEFDLDI